MSTTTTYDVMLRYRLDNKAGKGAEELADKLGHASREAHGLGSILGHLGAVAGGIFGIHGAYKALIDFNKEVDNAKISLTAMVEGGFGGSFEWARGQAEMMYAEFQKFSTQTPMTTREMMEFGRGTAMAVTNAGGGIKDIIEVTERGAVAAKAWGFESTLAAQQISEMIQGNIRNTEKFTIAMAGAGHKTLEQLRAMSASERLEFAKQTFNSPAMKDAIKSMSGSFSGVTSTLVDKLQLFFGKIGLPLFQAITAEVTRWNQWIDNNTVAIDHFASSVASGLVTAFNTVKSVFEFIWDHADTFITIGKVWAGIKMANMIGGIGGGAGLNGMLGNLGSNVGALGAGKTMGPAILAGLGGYELGRAIGLDTIGEKFGAALANLHTDGVADEFDRVTKSTAMLDQAMHDAATRMGGDSDASRLQGVIDDFRSQSTAIHAYLKAKEDVNNLTGDAQAEAAHRLVELRDALDKMGIDRSQSDADLAYQMGLANTRAGIDTGRRDVAGLETAGFMEMLERSAMTEYQRQTLNEIKAQSEIFGYINNHLARGIPINIGEILDILKNNTADPEGKHKAITEKPKVNVTIHRIEVQSDDPDRFAFAMVQSFRDAAKNPSSAVSALREG